MTQYSISLPRCIKMVFTLHELLKMECAVKTFSLSVLALVASFSLKTLADYPVVNQQAPTGSLSQFNPSQLQGQWVSLCIPNRFADIRTTPYGFQQVTYSFNGNEIDFLIQEYRDPDCNQETRMGIAQEKRGTWNVEWINPHGIDADISLIFRTCYGVGCDKPNDPRFFYSTPIIVVEAFSDNKGDHLRLGQRLVDFNIHMYFDDRPLDRVTNP